MFDVHVTFNDYSIKDLSQEDSNIETEYKVYSKPFFSQVHSLHFFLIVAHYMVVGLGFWGWGFQLMGFKACGAGPSGVFWVGLSI